MEFKCSICESKYKSINSDATYVFIFCSQKCEDESYEKIFDESDLPSEYLKDDMSNL